MEHQILPLPTIATKWCLSLNFIHEKRHREKVYYRDNYIVTLEFYHFWLCIILGSSKLILQFKDGRGLRVCVMFQRLIAHY